MKSFRDYHVWQRAHELTLAVYRITEGFPRSEQYGLASQMRRSSSSVPTNIAEGAAMGDAQFSRYLTIAIGSAAELEYQFILARDLHYIDLADYEGLESQVIVIRRQLIRLLEAIRVPPEKGKSYEAKSAKDPPSSPS